MKKPAFDYLESKLRPWSFVHAGLLAINGGAVFTAAFILLCTISCVPQEPGDETLLLYARTMDVFRSGRFAEAAVMLKGENKFAPSLILRGKAEYFSGDLASSEKTLRRAAALNPRSSDAALYLARVLREAGNAAGAQKLIDSLLGDHPSDVRALRFAAALARDRGVSGEAASAALLEKAVEALSESALVFLDRARQRWIGGNGSGALEDLDRAKALLPAESPVKRSLEKLESAIRGVSS